MSQKLSPPPIPMLTPAKPEPWNRLFQASSMMLGTGIFVGLGIVATVADATTGWAVTLAALLALLNSFAEVQAATSDQTNPLKSAAWLQFTCDWTLFLAKLTSAAMAGLGVAGYLLSGLGYSDPIWQIPTALVVVGLMTLAVSQQRTQLRWPRFTVILAALALLILIGAGIAKLQLFSSETVVPFQLNPWPSLLQATALMTIVYAGYEPLTRQRSAAEAQQVFRTVRLAILLLWGLGLGITLVGLNTIGAPALGTAVDAFAAPLMPVMQYLALPFGPLLMSLGAIVAMLKMLITLLPQLAERLLRLSQFEQPGLVELTNSEPNFTLSTSWAIKLVGIGLGCIVLVGDVRAIWSFSTAALLMHYALMHRVAVARSPLRWQSQWLHGLGLCLCLLLAFQVEWEFWLVVLGLIALGLVWQGVNRWTDEEE